MDKEIRKIDSYLLDKFEIIKTHDSSKYFKDELNKIYRRTIYTLIILLFFLVLATRNLYYITIVTIGFISCIGISLLFYFLLSIQINLISLAGITLSFSLVIDNIIVMISHLRKKHNIRIYSPLLVSTLTTVGTLLIVYYLNEISKINLIDFAKVIMVNLYISLLISLFLIPPLIDKISTKNTFNDTSKRAKRLDGFFTIY